MLENGLMNSPHSPDLAVQLKSGIGVVEIDRGSVNALPLATWNGITNTFATLHDDTSIRVVLLHGGDGRFCSGADIAELASPDPDTDDAAMLLAVTKAADMIRSCRVPVVAAIDGPAHGGGLELALACDLRIASERATFAASGANMGLIAGIGSLIDAVGNTVARRMLLTGQPIDATTAKDWGIVTDIADAPFDAAEVLAKSIAAKAPLAIEAAKAALNQHPTQSSNNSRTQLADTFRVLANTSDHQEAVAAFLEKRSPTFTRE